MRRTFSSPRWWTWLSAALLLACAMIPAVTRSATGWKTTATPEIRAITSAGRYIFTISYSVGSQTRVTATAFWPATGREAWRIAIDHMRSDVQHVELAAGAESLYVTVGDPLDANGGYLLSLDTEPGSFQLLPPRPGQRAGVAVIGQTIWTTVGGAGGNVKWRALDAGHTKFAQTLGTGGAPGCIGRPLKHGRFLLLPEGGSLTIASTTSGKVVRSVKVSSCTWGAPVVLGPTVAVMSSAEGGSMTVAGVDPVGGRVRWRVPAPPNPTRTPYVPTLTASGRLALATYAKKGLVLDAVGRVRRDVAIEGVTMASALSGARVVCATKSRNVMVVDLTAGTTKTICKMDSEIGALYVAPGGHVFVGASEELRDLGAL